MKAGSKEQLAQELASGKTYRIFAFGGGVQSVATLVLAAQGKVHYDYYLFSNVGHDSESPGTLAYFYEVAIPFAEKVFLPLIELKKYNTRVERHETLREYMFRVERSVPIPAYLASGAPGNRACTVNFKINVIDRWVKKNLDVRHYVCGLGISTDEIERARTPEWKFDKRMRVWKSLENPLIEQLLSRHQCASIIRKVGLPPPPKSACYFCPLQSRNAWRRLKRDQPDLFAKAIDLERHLNEKRGSLGKDGIRLHRSRKPLGQAVDSQLFLFDEAAENCESGFCMT